MKLSMSSRPDSIRTRTVPENAAAATSSASGAEPYYYQKQIQSRTPLVVVLHDGKELRGTLEWYDATCFKLQRGKDAGDALVYKRNVKYIYKDGAKSATGA